MWCPAYNTHVTATTELEVPPPKAPPSEIAGKAVVARGFTNAPVAAAMIVSNLAVFVGQVLLSGRMHDALDVPERLLRWLGANASLSTIADSRFETLVTSCFLHHNILHLALNMLLLWQVGPLLERAIGSARFLPVYLAAGIAASASSAIWGRFFVPTCSVGASGALCGLIAALMVVGIRTEGWKSELTIGMGRWLGLIVLVGLVRAVRPEIAQLDNAAHIGGALAGGILASTWHRGFRHSQRAERAILVGCASIVFASAMVVFVRNRTDPYLFLQASERHRVAEDALQAGNCLRARTAIRRALAMDPRGRSVRETARAIEAECWDPAVPRR